MDGPPRVDRCKRLIRGVEKVQDGTCSANGEKFSSYLKEGALPCRYSMH